MWGKASATRWRRTILAVVVTGLATAGALRLFFAEPCNDAGDTSAFQTVLLAGRIDRPFVEEPQVVNPAPPPITIALTLDRSAPIESSLQDAGLGVAEARKWSSSIEQSAGISNFQSGHSLTLYRDPESDELRGLKYNLDDHVAVRESSYGAGVLRTSRELVRYTVEPVALSFRLTNNFWQDAEHYDLPRPIIATLDYAFNDRHPLSTLPRGSDIKLIYQEKVSHDGSTHFVTGLEAAEIRFGGKTLTAVAFRDENGQARLYDANGEALGAHSLRFPLNFEYISSGFTLHRYHPILHEYRAHFGVDLVARYGTPVEAVADGRVEMAGWCGELGRCVRIRHEGGVVSIYGHLSKIPPGIEGGANVRAGQVIGRVGSSGLSTGPHLHYALEKDGRFVNPLTETIGVNHPVSPRMRRLFDRFKMNYLALLNRLPALGAHMMLGHGLPTVAGDSAPGVTAVIDSDKTSSISLRRKYRRPVVETTADSTVIAGRSSIMR